MLIMSLVDNVFDEWDQDRFFIKGETKVILKGYTHWKENVVVRPLPQPWFRRWLYDNIGYHADSFGNPLRYHLKTESRNEALNEAKIRQLRRDDNYFHFLGSRNHIRIHFGNKFDHHKFSTHFGTEAYPWRFELCIPDSEIDELEETLSRLPVTEVRYKRVQEDWFSNPGVCMRKVSVWLRDENEAVMLKLRYM